MKKEFRISSLNLALCILSILFISTLTTSCSSARREEAPKEPVVASAPVEQAIPNLQVNGTSDLGTAGPITTIHFAFDSAAITGNDQTILDQNVNFLKNNDSITIQIEGHCDERGSTQYNLALGELRARSVMNYLINSGVAANRISTISYGEERPISPAHDEAAWAQNRRTNFVIIAR